VQGLVLSANGKEAGAFDLLARKVRSGDPDNVEAQAARRYWKALFGPDFARDRSAEGANALLNYGYTVLRAIVSRAICAAGLHPTIGVFHANRTNAFALSDDLMEPYRPLVDQLVFDLVAAGEQGVSAAAKHHLAGVTAVDLDNGDGTVSPLSVQVQRFVHSVAESFVTGRRNLVLPIRPTARRDGFPAEP
jgi:CRISP-associated protein Cas1